MAIRRECLDHVVVSGERHLRHILLSYMSHHRHSLVFPSVEVTPTYPPIWHAWPHCEPRDRPMDVFGGVTSPAFRRRTAAPLLLPIIPPKKAAAQKRGSRRN